MAREALPVSTVVTLLKDVLEGSELFSDLWVVGEVSNFMRSQLGHRYFSLKDSGGLLRAVLFRDSAPGAKLANGDRVLAHGRVSVYVARGDLQFICDFVRPEGVGIQAARLEQLRGKLEKEGLFEPARKRPLPRFPLRIGLVTSATGAALQDIRRVLASRWPVAYLTVRTATVQGDQAVFRLLEALEDVGREPDLDFVILARGGGSAEDLGAFNEEAVARAVFGFPVPVVTGLGHETDWTLADLVADVRAPTPSAAVERSTPDLAEVRRAIASYARAAEGRAAGTLALRARELGMTGARMNRAAPDFAALRRDAATCLDRMGAVILREVQEGRLRLAEMGARVAALDPAATLARGFAIVEREQDGRVVTSVTAVQPGDRLLVGVKDGSFPVEVR